MTVPKCDNVRGIGVEHFFVAAEPCRLAVGFPVGLEYFDLETALTSTILGPLIRASAPPTMTVADSSSVSTYSSTSVRGEKFREPQMMMRPLIPNFPVPFR